MKITHDETGVTVEFDPGDVLTEPLRLIGEGFTVTGYYGHPSAELLTPNPIVALD